MFHVADLEIRRNLEGKLHDTVVQEWGSILQSPGGGRPIIHGDEAGKRQLDVGAAHLIDEVGVGAEGLPNPL